MSALSKLSPREREICDLLVRGYTREEAAGLLGITHRTAHSHYYRAKAKLQVKREVHLVAVYVREALHTARVRASFGMPAAKVLEPFGLFEEAAP